MLRLPTSFLSAAVPSTSRTRLLVEDGDPITPILSAWSNEFFSGSVGVVPRLSIFGPITLHSQEYATDILCRSSRHFHCCRLSYRWDLPVRRLSKCMRVKSDLRVWIVRVLMRSRFCWCILERLQRSCPFS